MKLPWLLFGLLVALCVVVGAAFVIEEVPAGRGHGYAHAEFPSMDAGGPGAPRHGPILWLAWAFAVLQIAFIVACLAFGARRGDRVGGIGLPLAVGGLLFAGIVTMMVVSYRQYMLTDAPDLSLFMFMALPGPTAWYLYVFWPLQFFFVLLFVLAFRRSIVDDDTMTRFREIVAAKRRREADAADSA